MSRVDGFNPDQGGVKRYTNPEGDGLSKASSGLLESGSPPAQYDVSVKTGAVHASDVTVTHVGPGVGIGGGSGAPTSTQGFVSSTGNKILINNTPGADTVELHHHTGAQIFIDADGSIHIFGTGRKGVNMVAPGGDGTVYASQHLILKGDGSITIETEGDLEFNVGKNLLMNVGGDMIQVVEGSKSVQVDGSYTEEIVRDASRVVGGISRLTVAGNKREQITGTTEFDSGNSMTIRTDRNVDINAKNEIDVKGQAKVNIDSSDGNVEIGAGASVEISAKSNIQTTSDGQTIIEATGDGIYRTKANMIVSSKANLFIDSQGPADIRTNGALTVFSGGATNIKNDGVLNMHSSGAMDLRGSTIDLNKGSPTAREAATPSDTRAAITPKSPDAAVYESSDNIIDKMTSERESPEFPENANRLSNEKLTTMENEGSEAPSKARARAIGNKGAGAALNPGQAAMIEMSNISSDHNRPAGSATFSVARQSPYAPPVSTSASNQRLSKHITAGMIPGFNQIPASNAKEIIANLQNICYNILDPLFDEFPGQIELTSGYRSWGQTSQHRLGKAIDLRAKNKADWNLTAKLAAFIRDNLPYDRLFLEKNDSPGIHVHVESAQPGRNGSGFVQTCQDPRCSTAVPGLQLQYAVAAFNRSRMA